MAQDKNIESMTGLFFLASLILLGIDIVTLGNASFNSFDIKIFNGFAAKILDMGLYSDGKYYIIRLFIIAMVFMATFAGKPKKQIKKINVTSIVIQSIVITVVFVFTYAIFHLGMNVTTLSGYVLISFVCYALLINYFSVLMTSLSIGFGKDRFGVEDRKFEQTKHLMENEYSVNIKTDDGFINVVNPFRAGLIIGTPGSGKTFAVLYQVIMQMIQKQYAMWVYDYKFPTLTIFVYNTLRKYIKNWDIEPEFLVINFDDPKKSHRCNPLQPKLLKDSVDAVESSKAIMIALNRSWNNKQGDFFVESPINYVACLIWALKVAEKGRFCSLPHLIELLSKPYEQQFMFLNSLDDPMISNMAAPFISAYQNDASDQLEGQIASARLGLSRLTSPIVYWVMTTDIDPETGEEIDGIDLQINDPKKPKVLCTGNNPDREQVYGVCLSLFSTRLMRLMNKPGMHKSAIIIDELTTTSNPKGTLDTIIATGRSNKISVWLGFQDITQAVRDFSKENAESIVNTIGNIFFGSVSGETAQRMSRMFGKIKVQKENVSVSDSGTSVSYSEQNEELLPESVISTMSQGVFAGKISDNFGEEIEQKFFYSRIHVDLELVSELEKGELPEFTKFMDYEGNPLNSEQIDQVLFTNFKRIKKEVEQLLERQLS